jgi:multidrug resistance efflux pump
MQNPLSTLTNKMKTAFRAKKPEIVCGIICLLVSGALGRILWIRHFYVESSYANLQGYFVPINAAVAGEVTHVFVHENEKVRKGQLLGTLDDQLFRAELKNAEAERDAAETQAEFYRRDAYRIKALFRARAVSAQALDLALSKSSSFRSLLQEANAKIELARQNLGWSKIVAPDDGIVSFQTARRGFYARKGEPLFGFVFEKERWVQAKLRETDLLGVRPGDSAKVSFDSLPGRVFTGTLKSIDPSAESTFSAMADDFSAGNYTKYVQWESVRIDLELDPQIRSALPIGVSAEVEMSRRRAGPYL